MLIALKVTNFRSIKETQEFSMLPVGRISEYPSHLISINKNTKLLRSNLIYGRNASGKSNLIKAFSALTFLVRKSAESKIDTDIIPYEPFMLEKNMQDMPIAIEIQFLGKDKIKYHYSIAYNKKKIIKENLYYYPSNQPAKLFTRNEHEGIKPRAGLIGKVSGLIEKLYDNQLFLSKVGTEKIPELIEPYLYLTKYLYVYNNLSDFMFEYMFTTLARNFMDNLLAEFTNNMNNLLKFADLGIEDVVVKEREIKFPASVPEKDQMKIKEQLKYELKILHPLYDKKKRIGNVDFNIDDESNGTKKFMIVSNYILDALNDGSTLIIDELDKSLHPLLTKILIYMFNNPEINVNNAQLIFATHDVSLLDSKLFRRDQVLFSEKNNEGESTYYSLGDIKGVRKGINYEKYYMNGAFGAIPILNKRNLRIKIQEYGKEKI